MNILKSSLIFIILICCGSVKAQVFNPDKPMIREFAIYVDSINVQLKKYQNPRQMSLKEEMGCVQIPNTYYVHNGKSQGIIVVQTNAKEYLAVDARCAHCFYDNGVGNGKVKFETGLGFVCDKCGAAVQRFEWSGSAQMDRYDTDEPGYQYLDTYVVDKVKKDGKTYLIISNSTNGSNDEWMLQPENKCLLINGKEYVHPLRPMPKFSLF